MRGCGRVTTAQTTHLAQQAYPALSRDSHVADLIEAAYQSYNDENEADALKANYAFSALQSPGNPDGAAMPMLNGQVFAPNAIGEGDESGAAFEELIPTVRRPSVQ